jgi:hypothetical protein
MKGVVFHTSVRMITNSELTRSPNQSLSAVLTSPFTKPVVESKAKRQARAATTVTIP